VEAPATGWGYYTPFAAVVSGMLRRATTPVFGLMAKWPLIGRLSVLRAPH